jgi:hypothetical protein
MTGSAIFYSRKTTSGAAQSSLTMQRLHEDDLVGHVLGQEPWEVVCFPAIAETDELHEIETIWRPKSFTRRQGDALRAAREPLPSLRRNPVVFKQATANASEPRHFAAWKHMPASPRQRPAHSIPAESDERNRIAMLGASPWAWLLRSRGKGAPLI